MSALKGRLRRFEEAARGGACAVCGLPPDGPNYIIDWGEEVPEDPDEECPHCGRRLWWVCEIEMPKADERLRVFVADTKQRDRELLERNRASVGLPPLTPEQVVEYELEETKWEVDDG
jgi:hypothetical protein